MDRPLAELGGDERARAREIDLLRFEVDELSAAGLEDPDEDERLAVEEDALADALAHQEAALAALDALDTDEGAVAGLARAVAALDGRGPFAEAVERLRSVEADLVDVAGWVRARGESIDDDPVRLEAVQQRRRLLHELTRKYGDTLAEVMAFQAEAAARLAVLEDRDRLAAELDERRAQARPRAPRPSTRWGRPGAWAAPRLAQATLAHRSSWPCPGPASRWT